MPEIRSRVIVAGGGLAAVETILALRALAPNRFDVDLFTPGPELVLRPYDVLAPFHEERGRRFALARIAADAQARLVRDGIAAVDPRTRLVVTNDGVEHRYDALVVAEAAQRVHPIAGALPFRGARDADVLKTLVMESQAGRRRRIAFIVPGGPTWTLPIYELALHIAAWLERRGVYNMPLTIVSPEPEPLAVFGRAASEEVSRLLDAHRIRFVHGYAIHLRGERLHLLGGEELEAHVAMTLPRLMGAQVAGLPMDRDGFLPVDSFGQVVGIDDVFAAGDATSFPIKHGGLATQQADALAERLSALGGVPVLSRPFVPVLRATLTGLETRYLVTKFGERGETSSTVSSEPLWAAPTTVAGRYLAPYLERADEVKPARAAVTAR